MTPRTLTQDEVLTLWVSLNARGGTTFVPDITDFANAVLAQYGTAAPATGDATARQLIDARRAGYAFALWVIAPSEPDMEQAAKAAAALVYPYPSRTVPRVFMESDTGERYRVMHGKWEYHDTIHNDWKQVKSTRWPTAHTEADAVAMLDIWRNPTVTEEDVP